MKLVIETWINKVIPDPSHPLGWNKPVAGEYELLHRTPMGYDSRTPAEFAKDCKTRHKHRFMGEIRPGVFKYDLGQNYGIHSYQIVYQE